MKYLDLIAAVESGSTNMHSYDHGPQHWRCVAKVGMEVARLTPGADVEVAFLFGLFHDSMRVNDHRDPDHGPRAAALVRRFAEAGSLTLESSRLQLLAYACETHTKAPATTDPVLGACYDADRLNLWRVGIIPHPFFLSTEAGKQRTKAYKHLHETALSWEEVVADFERGPS